jgi:uncharacterized protein YgiM (DUF1202 family)
MKQSTLTLTLFIMATLACSITPTGNNSTSTSVVQKATESVNGGTPPKVVIETPGSDAQAVIAQPLTVRVHATDTVGVTRVEMRESGRVVASQPSPEPASDFTALLQYKPISTGHITLEVVAFRQSTVSDPARVTVTVVGSAAELTNPSSLNPTLGVAAGTICTTQVAVSGLAFRVGPGIGYRQIGTLQVSDNLTVIGRNHDMSWFQVKRANGTIGWLSAGYTVPNGDCSKAPETTPSP